MATAFDDNEKKKPTKVPKKATKQGYYTIEPRPYNPGEIEFLRNLAMEFKPSELWIDDSKKMNGQRTFIVYTDTAERAEFVDYLLDKMDLPGAQHELERMTALEADPTEYPRREGSIVHIKLPRKNKTD